MMYLILVIVLALALQIYALHDSYIITSITRIAV